MGLDANLHCGIGIWDIGLERFTLPVLGGLKKPPVFLLFFPCLYHLVDLAAHGQISLRSIDQP